jgi:hypothetical protein
LVERSSSTLPCIPSGSTFGQLWQSAALVLQHSAVLALGCSGARLVPRLAIPARGDGQRSAASALSGHLVLIFSAWGSLTLLIALHCLALDDLFRSPTFGTLLLSLACLCVCILCLHVFHLGVYSRVPLGLFDHISQPFSGGMVYLFFIFSRGCYSKLLFADYRGGMVLVSKVSINTSR